LPRIVVCGAGGAPSEGVIHSLLTSDEFDVIGFGADAADLINSAAPTKVLIPFADSPTYKDELLSALRKHKPDLVHFQNDLEVLTASAFRDEIENLGVKTFMPRHEVIETCTNKYLSYLKFRSAGLTVPQNILLTDKSDLLSAFSELADQDGRIWIRDSRVGGGGKGSLSTNNFELAESWVESANGWGHYLAAEHLTKDTVTWQSIWWNGELVAAQGRRRFGWVHGNRSASGVTGVTQVGETYSSRELDEASIQAILAIDNAPHGLYGVDFTLDKLARLNPTEINISRFFTTIRFFTEAGLNMPEIFARLGTLGVSPNETTLNPLPNGLLWLRGMDRAPVLMTRKYFDEFIAS